MKSNEATTLLAALAQETRLEVFRALVRTHSTKIDDGGLAAGDIAALLKVAPATLSFHLKELAHAGLVTSRKDGRSIIYKANLDAMQNLVAYLLEDCCAGACDVKMVKMKAM